MDSGNGFMPRSTVDERLHCLPVYTFDKIGAIVSSLLKTMSGGSCLGGETERSKYENRRLAMSVRYRMVVLSMTSKYPPSRNTRNALSRTPEGLLWSPSQQFSGIPAARHRICT